MKEEYISLGLLFFSSLENSSSSKKESNFSSNGHKVKRFKKDELSTSKKAAKDPDSFDEWDTDVDVWSDE